MTPEEEKVQTYTAALVYIVKDYEEAVKEFRLVRDKVMALRHAARGLSRLLGIQEPFDTLGPILPEDRLHQSNLANRANPNKTNDLSPSRRCRSCGKLPWVCNCPLPSQRNDLGRKYLTPEESKQARENYKNAPPEERPPVLPKEGEAGNAT